MKLENMNINQNNSELDDEIDLKILFFTLWRNKKFIIVFTLISTIFGIINFSSRKDVWEGSLNILYKENYIQNKEIEDFLFETSSVFIKSKGIKARIFNLSRVTENHKKKFQDAEEIKKKQKLIIGGPSILIPIYNIDQDYNKKSKSNYSKISFREWKKNSLKFDFIDKSSLLSVNYRSSDKEHLLNILNLISINYQNYFKDDKKEIFDNNIPNLENQIKLIRKKRISSIDKIILTFLEEEIGFAKKTQFNNYPWKIIYKPFINDTPIQKKEFPFESIYLPLILSSLIVLIKEKLYGNIFDIDMLKKNIPYKLIEIIYIKDSFLISNILTKILNINSIDNIALISISNEFFYNNFENSIDLLSDNFNYKFIKLKNIHELNNFKYIFLIAEVGKINLGNLKLLNNYLIMHKEKINGYFIINTSDF